jgi:hypothetical protein
MATSWSACSSRSSDDDVFVPCGAVRHDGSAPTLLVVERTDFVRRRQLHVFDRFLARITRELSGSVTSFRVALAARARSRQYRRSSAPLRSFPRMASNTTFQKRQKERARLDKQRDKSEEKKLRREQPHGRVTSEPGVDPDIAGIIPGPQPLPDEFL